MTVANKSFIYAVRTAQQIIEDYQITEPKEIDLEAIALDRGVFVIYTEIQGSVARLQIKGNHGLIAVDNRIKEHGRSRFAVAHELGHFEIHRARAKASICSEFDLLRWNKSSTEETEANIFAAELLMPTDMFKRKCPKKTPSFNVVSELANEFSSSLTATAIKYVEKGPFPSALMVSNKGKIAWTCKSEDFYFKVRGVGSHLDKYSCAGAFFYGEVLPPNPEPVEASSWLDDLFSPNRVKLWEHSIFLRNYDTILSLIWAD